MAAQRTLGRAVCQRIVSSVWPRGCHVALACGTSNPWQLATCRTATALSAAATNVLDAKVGRYDEVSEALQSGETASRDIGKLSKELGRLTPAVELYQSYRELTESLEELHALRDGCDPEKPDEREMMELAAEEAEGVRRSLEEAVAGLQVHLIPTDEADSRDVILEVRPAAGGDEAALFAADMFRMYERYCQRHGWQFEAITFSKLEAGGVREATAQVRGEEAFGTLKFESGVHRVQRVPATESNGRTHTSTVTVAVLPEAEEVDVDIKPADLRIDTYRAQGAGGQHVNTTDSAVRITHIPTGLVVAIQDERSQHQNRAKALQVLRSRLFEQQRLAAMLERSDARKAQVGTGDRSERVRTYNYLQDRVTDHRVAHSMYVGCWFGVASMLDGAFLDEFIEKLREDSQAAAIAALEEEVANE